MVLSSVRTAHWYDLGMILYSVRLQLEYKLSFNCSFDIYVLNSLTCHKLFAMALFDI